MSDHLFLIPPSFSALSHREKKRVEEKEHNHSVPNLVPCNLHLVVTTSVYEPSNSIPLLHRISGGCRHPCRRHSHPRSLALVISAGLAFLSILLKSRGMCHSCLAHPEVGGLRKGQTRLASTGLQTSWNWCISGTWIINSMAFCPHWPISPPSHLSPFLLSSA